ncbi:conserved hypothetical protein [Candidatus Caldarchaeum subterraneum]|uniref:Helicase HerA central domain-containing protein n=1 Tax=Caldiarchaeum subterraneum TaxID=311458 RepID=E6N8P5_CALS0|nr:conserved hypothetical protein [Candidatus Caldarchaeum subterraneum]BAJ51369.1 conserved hypothetical protein [Candidatus Caldarchaeum subterraneum]
MKILQKHGETLELLCMPSELDFEIGDYIKLGEGNSFLLAQVVDVGYVDLPGGVEELLRELIVAEVDGVSSLDPYNTSSLSMMVREVRCVTAKVRAIFHNGLQAQTSPWLPSRYTATHEKAGPHLLHQLILGDENQFLFCPGTVGGEPINLPLTRLDGSLTIITGKKESGKSHLAKIIVEGIVSNGGTVVVLDVNGEYLSLDKRFDGGKSDLADALTLLHPGRNFTASLRMMGLKTFHDIMEHVYGTPATSLRELGRIWKKLEKECGDFCLDDLMDVVENEPMNEAVREALLSRLESINSSGFISDNDPTDLAELLKPRPGGNVTVVNLSKLLPSTRRLVVEYLLSHLSTLLSSNKIEPLFLLAEEAHLYLRETYWEDLVTRMRHIGMFPIFVTNQPDTIPELVYRQADNIFLFNFTNDTDLEKISKISKIDSETVKLLVKKMPPRRCLVLGKIVSDIPLMLKVRTSSLMTMGQTKLFFKRSSATKDHR